MILEDEGYRNSVYALLEEEQSSAEYAVSVASDKIAKRFEQLEDDYMKARAGDIRDVSGRLLSILTKPDSEETFIAEIPDLKEPCILVTDELYPAQLVQLNHENLRGIVTKKGSEYSHTAILARMLGIPAVTGIDVDEMWHGKMGILDTEESLLTVEPDENVVCDFYGKEKKQRKQQQELENMRGVRLRGKSGAPLTLLANVGELRDIHKALAYDAEGIGLFRTEFLFMEKSMPPTEDEQFRIYQKAVQMMSDKPVIIRTLDVGGDKQIPFLLSGKIQKHERGVVFYLQYKELFIRQLKAIFRAAVFGDIRILYPMISSMKDADVLEQLIEEAESELSRENITYRKPLQGFMIETPEAVDICQQLAQRADFFSIGTNDLLRSVSGCEADRDCLESEKERCCQTVLSWIEKIIQAARNACIPVGICGEMGADFEWTRYFLKWEADSLSMSPNRILKMRKHCCDIQGTLLL